MNKNNEIVLDIIPIYVGEMYPTKEEIWHFSADLEIEADRVHLLDEMFIEIKHKFGDCDSIIILENRKVLKVL